MPQTITFSQDDVKSAPIVFGHDEAQPVYRSENEKDAQGNATVDPNTVGTFARHLWSQVNPAAAINAIADALPIPRAAGGQGVSAPLDTIKRLGTAQGAVFDKAKASYEKGDYATAARHFVDYLIPVLGPVLDKSSDLFQAGKWAAGGGDAIGLGLAMFGPKALANVGEALSGSKPAQAVADVADEAANRRVVDVIAPKVGANKVRFGRMAEDVAPKVARETTGLTRSGVADAIASKLEEATTALDEAGDARLAARGVPTQPVIDALKAARRRLTAQAVEGASYPAAEPGVSAPLGADVIPAPNAARVAPIDQAIKEVQQLGPVARYDALKQIRQAYDAPAKAVYAAAVTPDYLAKMGDKLGAADVTGALRTYLAKLDPQTAAANANYSLWKKASDVVSAAEEVDRVRPTVGRTILARGLGAAAGGAEGGTVGAVTGAIIGPLVERVATSVSPALKLTVARNLAALADALRGGHVTRAQATLRTLQGLVPATASLRQTLPATMLAAPAAAEDSSTAPGRP